MAYPDRAWGVGAVPGRSCGLAGAVAPARGTSCWAWGVRYTGRARYGDLGLAEFVLVTGAEVPVGLARALYEMSVTEGPMPPAPEPRSPALEFEEEVAGRLDHVLPWLGKALALALTCCLLILRPQPNLHSIGYWIKSSLTDSLSAARLLRASSPGAGGWGDWRVRVGLSTPGVLV